jgi:hypothetical protein
MEVVSHPNPDHPARQHDHLWLLVGGGPDYSDGATAYYLGSDRDIDGVDLASERLIDVVHKHELDREEAKRALTWYRSYVR